jgi:adenosylcobinamide-phosphate guanylyltransferase
MVTALLMAGGKGNRMEGDTEKPLIELFGNPMIQHVLDALSSSNRISDIIVATSPNTPKTEEYVRNMGFKIFQTPGNGYIEDLQYFISENFSDEKNHVILTITSDMPLITNETIDLVVKKYIECSKPAMCIAVPVDMCHDHGLKPSIMIGDVVPS